MNTRTLILTIGLALPSAAFGDFINGSFEDPSLGMTVAQSSYTGTALPGWNLSGPSSGYVMTNQVSTVPGWDETSWHPSPDGNQFLYISAYVIGGEVLSQSVDLKAGANELQFLEADFSAPFYYGTAKPGGAVDVAVFDASNNLVASHSFTTPDFSDYISQSLTFSVATAGTYTFAFTSVQDHAGIIDGVTVNAVPEPMTMLVLGGAGLLLGKRRKANKA